jgi:hypothetical protein
MTAFGIGDCIPNDLLGRKAAGREAPVCDRSPRRPVVNASHGGLRPPWFV